MGFQKGQSGNPRGRPKVLAEVRDAINGKLAKGVPGVVDMLLSICGDKKQKASDRIAAGRVILEWSIPKPSPDLGPTNAERLKDLVSFLKGGDGT